MKKLFLEKGTDTFNDHQLVEFMLFFCLPQGDTNETAHRLINEFGSLKNIFHAPFERLTAIKGIGDHAATMLHFMPQLMSRYYKELYSAPGSSQDPKLSGITEFFKADFSGVTAEEVHIAALSSDDNVISSACISYGDIGKAGLSLRSVASFVLAAKTKKAAIAHNHPGATFLPSAEDIQATADVAEMLEELDTELTDHIIIGDGGAFSMRGSMHASTIWKKDGRSKTSDPQKQM